MMKVIFYTGMVCTILILPALTEIAVDSGLSDTRMIPSLIISTLWVLAIIIYHHKKGNECLTRKTKNS